MVEQFEADQVCQQSRSHRSIDRSHSVAEWHDFFDCKGQQLRLFKDFNPKLKTVAVECLRLSEPRTIPEGWTKSALDVLARDWTSIVTPEGKDLWIQLKTGKAQYSSRLCRSLLMPRLLIPMRIGVMSMRLAMTKFAKKYTRFCVPNTSA